MDRRVGQRINSPLTYGHGCTPPSQPLPAHFVFSLLLYVVAHTQLVPFSTHNGRTIGHASTLTRLFCTPGARPSGSSWQPPVFGEHGAAPPSPDPDPGTVAMNGRFMYDEDAQHLLLRTALGGNPVWMGYAFRTQHHDVYMSSNDGIASTADGEGKEGGDDIWEEARAEATIRGKRVTDAIVEAARRCGFGSVDRVRSITLYVPGAELSADGVAKHVMIRDERMHPRSWGEDSGDAAWGGASVDNSWTDRDQDDDITDNASEGTGSSSRLSPWRPSNPWEYHSSSSSSDLSDASDTSSAASTITVVSGAGATSRGHATRLPPWQRGDHASDGRGSSALPQRRPRRPRTSVIDFSNFAASLSANVTGVYRHCMPPSWPGDLSSYYGSEGVVPASSVLLPLFRGATGPRGEERSAAAVSGAGWGIVGGGEARFDGLAAAMSSLALTTTPLVRDAERLLAPPLPAAVMNAERRGRRGGSEKEEPLPRHTGAVAAAARCRRAAVRSVTAAGGLPRSTAAATEADAAGEAHAVSTFPADSSGTVPSSAAVAPFVALFEGDGGRDGSASSVPSSKAVKAFESLF